MATVDEIQARIAVLEKELTAISQRIAFANPNDRALIQELRFEYNRVNAELTALRTELFSQTLEEQRKSLATASSGQVILEEKTSPSNPAAPASVLAPSGRINPDNVETGTNAPVRSQDQTQATPPAGNGAPLPFSILDDDGNPLPGFATTQAGAAANRDDNTRPNSNSTAQIINASFNQRIVPRKNILDEYASYTYSVTWYLLTPDQYNEMVRSKKKNCASWQLLMQSGGAPTVAADATATASSPAGRNKFFDLDYYIDDLEIESMIPLKGTGAANTATNIRFKVTEPSGITLIENLSNAVKTLYKERNVDKNANYPMAQYCLVVRFYGYNENGELITTGRRGTNGQTNLTDPRAIVEKFYPFVITNIKFRIPRASVVEYQVEAKPIPHFYNKSQDRGSIPFAFELAGTTVEQILQGKPVGTVYPASAGERRDSPTPNTSAPTQPAEPTSGAGVDVNGNFTGDITPGSISSVIGA
jgi:hypothetical protein